MKILVFSWRDIKHPMAGGAEQVIHEHMKCWVEAGHSVTHFSSRIIGNPKKEEVINRIKMIRMGYQLLGVNILGALWYIFGNHPKFDLVIDEFHGIPFFTPLFVRAKKIAVLQEVAREVWFKNHLPFPLNYIVGAIGFFLEPFLFLLYRNTPFMVGSDSAKTDLIRMGIHKKNIFVIPHGILAPKLTRSFSKEKINTIIYLGALARDKGIEDAIAAFGILNKAGDYNFWVVGQAGESYYKYLKGLAMNNGLVDNIKFWGFVSQVQKFELLAKSHVLINPSAREGWGLVNIEANSVGTPIVAYNSPGLIDSVRHGETGIICSKNTPENIAENIEILLKDKALYQTLQAGGMRWSRRFSWKKSTDRSLVLITSIVGLK